MNPTPPIPAASWLRAPSAVSGCAFPPANSPRAAGLVNKILAQGDHIIVESNSVVELVKPDVFLMLLDFGCEDFKPSSLRFMDRADGFVVIDRGINAPLWQEVARGLWDGKPQFLVKPPRYVTTELVEFVKSSGRRPVSTLSFQPQQFRTCGRKPAGRPFHLLFDRSQVVADARFHRFRDHIEAANAGFDVSKVLAQVVYEIREKDFRAG